MRAILEPPGAEPRVIAPGRLGLEQLQGNVRPAKPNDPSLGNELGIEKAIGNMTRTATAPQARQTTGSQSHQTIPIAGRRTICARSDGRDEHAGTIVRRTISTFDLDDEELALNGTRQSHAAPTSFAQEEWLTWFQRYPLMATKPGAEIRRGICCPKPLHKKRIQEAFLDLLRRNDALRTLFLPGELGACDIHDDLPSDVVQFLDLADPSGTEFVTEVKRIVGSSTPDSRFALPRCYYVSGPNKIAYLLLIMNHLTCDGKSMSLVLRELSALYEGNELNGPGYQYAHFARAQRHAFAEGLLDKELRYWRTELDRYTSHPVVRLPGLRTQPRATPSTATTAQRMLPRAARSAFDEYCRQKRFTPFVGYLAAVCLAIESVGGDQGTDFGVHCNLSSRLWPNTSTLPGLFASEVVLGIGSIGGDFGRVAQQIRASLLGAMAHERLPFPEVVHRYAEERYATISENPFVSFHASPMITRNTHPLAIGDPSSTTGDAIMGQMLAAEGTDIAWSPSISLAIVPRPDTDDVVLTCRYRVSDWFDDAAQLLLQTWADVIESFEQISLRI